MPGSQQRFHIVKPKFCHAVIVRLVLVARNDQPVALDQSAQSRNASTNRSVDVLPVVKELLVGQTSLFGDAINQLDHDEVYPFVVTNLLRNCSAPKRIYSSA